MSLARVRVWLVACAWLPSVAGSAHGQAAPPPPSAGSAAPAPGSPDAAGAAEAGTATAPTPAHPAAPQPVGRAGAGSASSVPDVATVQAGARAKSSGTLIEVSDPAAVAGCRDLGERYEETSVRGARGRLELRGTLKSQGRARGASHVRYSGYAVLDFNGQGERGHFYDCSPTGLLPPAPPPRATASAGAAAAPGIATPADAGAPSAGTVSTGAAGTRRSAIAFTGQFEFVPVGAVHTKVNDQSTDLAVGTSYGVSGNLEILPLPNLAIGLNPGVTFGLKGDMATAAATQVDVRARARVGRLAADGLAGYLYGTGGLSWIVAPNGGETSMGPIVGIGAGVSHRVDDSTVVAFEVGYQFGFQSLPTRSDGVSGPQTEVELSSGLFHIGFSVGWDL